LVSNDISAAPRPLSKNLQLHVLKDSALIQNEYLYFAGEMLSSSSFLQKAARFASNGSKRNAVTITALRGREIIDSRGNPTVEVDVHTTSGNFRGK
jgi:hypothetical protein